MNPEEFELALKAAQRHVESALIQLCSMLDKDGLLLASGSPNPMCDAFEAECIRLRRAYESGVVRCGMKVYPE